MINLQRPPRVLISAASRHESTTEIARAIADRFDDGRVEVDIIQPEVVDSIDDYDAVILGSAVYEGHWLAPARDFAVRFASALADRPVWLFSSGPVGNPAARADARDVTRIKQAIAIRDHHVFDGRLDQKTLSLTERISLMGRRTGGDYRDWDAVARWADGIAESLGLGRVEASPDGRPS
jgi:menaquinone-dependent protoporphyrinogen oxidase